MGATDVESGRLRLKESRYQARPDTEDASSEAWWFSMRGREAENLWCSGAV
jgi:hypothetical protein